MELLDKAPAFVETLVRFTGPITTGQLAAQAASGNPGVVFAIANAAHKAELAPGVSMPELLATYRSLDGLESLTKFTNHLVEHYGFDTPLTTILSPDLGGTPGSGVGIVAAITGGLGVLAAAATATAAVAGAVGSIADTAKKFENKSPPAAPSPPPQPVPAQPTPQQPNAQQSQAPNPLNGLPPAVVQQILAALGIPNDVNGASSRLSVAQPNSDAGGMAALAGMASLQQNQGQAFDGMAELLSPVPPADPFSGMAGLAAGSGPNDGDDAFTRALALMVSELQDPSHQESFPYSSTIDFLSDGSLDLPPEYDDDITSTLNQVAQTLKKGR